MSQALVQRSLEFLELLRRYAFDILEEHRPSGTGRWYKYAFCALLVVNAKSLPLMWHFRVFRPVIAIRLRQLFTFLRLWLFNRRAAREAKMRKWHDSICWVGGNPLDAVVTYYTRATIDDSDFNGHLSNSSYAKTFDAARFKAALRYVPAFLGAGGWIALGATNYHFIREIPMLAKYEVRVNIIGWDSKWIFCVGRYVTTSKPKRRLGTDTSPPGSTFKASLRTPAQPIDTPLPLTGEPTAPDFAKAAATLSAIPEPDGATLHCLAISQLCLKHGRITVPPSVVWAANGFSVPPSTPAAAPYSHRNPPPHWNKVREMRSGTEKAYVDFLRGGWKEDRWWEEAMGGEIEAKRKANMEILNGLRTGMEGARAMV